MADRQYFVKTVFYRNIDCFTLVIMINRVYVLWDRRTKVRSALLCGFIIFYGITVAFGVANIYMLSGEFGISWLYRK